MRVLVIGGGGFVGAHLVRALLGQKHNVVAYDNLFARKSTHGLEWLNQARLIRGDILDEQSLKECTREFKPDIVYHLAAIHYIPYCNEHPGEALRVNVEGTLRVLNACRVAGTVRAFVFASSGAVYGPTDRRHVESDTLDPPDVYGLSKQLAELVVEHHGKLYAVNYVIARLFNVYGPGETNPHILPAILEQVSSRARPIQLGRTDTYRDFVYVGDVVSALLAMGDHAASGAAVRAVMNVSAGREWSVGELVMLLAELSGETLEVACDEARVRATDRMHLRANIDHIRNVIGWTPRYDLKAGLAELIQTEFPGLARHSRATARFAP